MEYSVKCRDCGKHARYVQSRRHQRDAMVWNDVRCDSCLDRFVETEYDPNAPVNPMLEMAMRGSENEY